MKFGFRHADKFVGLFVLIAIIFITASVVVTGVNQRWFSRDYEYFTRFRTAEGLSVGMAIKLRGFQIGKVERIILNDKNQVDITFVIYDTFINKVVGNSMIELASNPLGLGGGINFYPGKNSKEIIPEFSFIPSDQTAEGKKLSESDLLDKPEGQDAITALMENVDPILNDVDSLLLSMTALLNTVDSALSGNQSSPIGGMLLNLEGTTQKFNTILPVIETIMQDVNRMTTSLSLLMAELEDPTGLIPKLIDPTGSFDTMLNDDNILFDQILILLNDVHANLDNLASITGDIRGITPELNSVLNEATGALQEGGKVLEGLSNNPLLRKGISDEVKASYEHSNLREEDF
ncbi:MAG: hypothetical protein B6241_06935 [Spirochaetaceae bacterium 4572_59]|nr:MAG: hypothetical protein B6241_06935 [Spirochaetaceae bacterium 4572_59]